MAKEVSASTELLDKATAIIEQVDDPKTLSTQRRHLEKRAQTLLLKGILLELKRFNNG